jgi:hypothetical protein
MLDSVNYPIDLVLVAYASFLFNNSDGGASSNHHMANGSININKEIR